MADAGPAERDGHGEAGPGHVRRVGLCSGSGCSHVLDQYEPPQYDESFGQVVPCYLTEDEEGRGVPLFVAAGQL